MDKLLSTYCYIEKLNVTYIIRTKKIFLLLIFPGRQWALWQFGHRAFLFASPFFVRILPNTPGR